jgi:hypothetical protein
MSLEDDWNTLNDEFSEWLYKHGNIIVSLGILFFVALFAWLISLDANEPSGNHSDVSPNEIVASDEDAYYRDVATIKKAVLEDTIDRGSARFCPKFVLVPSSNDNRVYVGWYRSKDLLGEYGQDNIVAETEPDGTLVQISIGEF